MMRRILVPAVVLLLLGAGSAGASSTPALSIDSVRTTETDLSTVVVLTASLDAPSAEPVSFHYATADGTADATDYVPTEGTITFAPGVTQARIAVFIKGDALDEADETFFVDVDGVRGTVTIVDDLRDRLPVQVLEASVSARWNVHRSYTRVARLVVARAPATASVDVGCAGKGCPFRFKTAGRNLTPLFRRALLSPGVRVQLTVDAPGQIGRRFVYRIRAGKAPARSVEVLD